MSSATDYLLQYVMRTIQGGGGGSDFAQYRVGEGGVGFHHQYRVGEGGRISSSIQGGGGGSDFISAGLSIYSSLTYTQ